MSNAIALAGRYEFGNVSAHSLRLEPRGRLRIVSADVSSAGQQAFRATPFFVSLLAHPLYHEMIVTHYSLPARGKHGPFNVADLTPADFQPIDHATLSARIDAHLGYRRYGAAPIPRHRQHEVAAFVAGLKRRCYDVYALAPCDRFSRPGFDDHAHEWSHALLEFHEYVLLDRAFGKMLCLIFAFD